MKVDLIIRHASELLTLAGSKGVLTKELIGALGVIEEGSIAIKDGKIVDIGKDEAISDKHEGREIDATGQLVMPGFVDPHTHLVYAGSRENELSLKVRGISYLEIAKRGGGIHKTVRMTRDASKAELMNQAEKRLNVMLRHGTTTAEVKSGYGLNTADEIKMLEVIQELDQEHPVELVPTFLGAHEIPKEHEEKPEVYVGKVINDMIPKVVERDLAEFCDVFVEKGVFSVKQGRRILEAGKRHGLTPRVHADELHQLGGAELAADIDAISASHLLHSSKKGLKRLINEKIVGIYLPAACMALLSEEFPNGREIIDRGLPLALATDLNPNCWLPNMQTVLMLAIYFMRVTPAEAITASTLNPAYSLGRGDSIGSLEKGKQADIVILDIPNHRWVGYKVGTNLVSKVLKDGEIVWNDNKEKKGGGSE